VNNQLGLSDRAIGILRHLRLRYPHIEIQSRWLEKLLRWEDACKAYVGDIQQCKSLYTECSPAKHERWIASELGRLRCLHALGESEELEMRASYLKAELKKESDFENEAPSTYMAEVQKLGANAAWMLGKWDKMEEFLDGEQKAVDPKDVVLEHNISFYQAVLAIHSQDYPKAVSLINDIRATISGSIAALLSESYSRAYRAMVTMQILAEMEEVVEYKKSVEKAKFDSEKVGASENSQTRGIALNQDNQYQSENSADLAAKKLSLIRRWRARLKWAPKDIEVYRQILVSNHLHS
jgi:serine/threonine-protein kinase mTOR